MIKKVHMDSRVCRKANQVPGGRFQRLPCGPSLRYGDARTVLAGTRARQQNSNALLFLITQILIAQSVYLQ